MNEKTDQAGNYTRLARYSLLLSVLGAASYLLMFPSGIYYAFLCGVIGASGGFLTKARIERGAYSVSAVVIGLIDILFSLLTFHGLNSLYSSLKDPVLGPQMTKFILDLLEQYGVPADAFVTIMNS